MHAALSTHKKISNMAPLALTFKEASLKVLTCRPAAVLEASREKPLVLKIAKNKSD